MIQREELVKAMDNPRALEEMYKDNENNFKMLLKDLYNDYQDNQILKVWYFRLFDDEVPQETKFTINKGFIFMLILAVLSGVITRLLYFLVSEYNISEINYLFGVVPFIGVLFLFNKPISKKLIIILSSILLVIIIYFNLLPYEFTDSIIISYLHLPILLWVILGYTFVFEDYKNLSLNLSYLKFNGEFLLLYMFFAIAGMILSMGTMLLFSFINLDVYQFYFENIVLFGAASLAVVAVYLVLNQLKIAKYILPLLAKVFSPLFLVTLVIFLVSILFTGNNPFTDREFLLLFNVILVLVLGVTVFSVIERNENSKKHLFDFVNIGLLFTTLIINIIALSAIIFRLTSYGITANRLAVILMNLVVFIHLLSITFSYVKYIFSNNKIETVNKAITKYIIVYGVWATVVIILFPILF